MPCDPLVKKGAMVVDKTRILKNLEMEYKKLLMRLESLLYGIYILVSNV